MTAVQGQTVQCPITEVTVYLQGAQITRCGTVTLKQGENQLVLGGLPSKLAQNSLQVSCEGGGQVVSVEFQVDHLQEAGRAERTRALEEDLKALLDRQNAARAQMDLCASEEELLVANRELGGANTGVKVAELREAVYFHHEYLAEIKRRQLSLGRELEELEREVDALQHQLGLSAVTTRPVGELTILMAAATNTQVELNVSYYMQDAAWSPVYDIRVTDIQSDVRLVCRARVSQYTEEEWDSVFLTVSTARPRSIAAVCPELRPWYLDLPRPQPVLQERSRKMERSVMMQEEMMDALPVAAGAAPVREEPRGVQMQEQMSCVEYQIPAACSVFSGSGYRAVEIATHALSARYQYLCVPRLDREVYLTARIEHYEHLNLVAGDANIFFGNRYVGKTRIDPAKAEEEITLSLGLDSGVVVNRVNGKRFAGSTLTGAATKNTREWEITARNLKSHPVELMLQDQVPVSADKQIGVDIQESSGGSLEKDTGILTWTLLLEPAQACSVTVRYVVTHPKDAHIQLD